ncbi:MAG: DNA repair protein RadC [Alistipes sp.]|nr:DNA repair protein RadC [Alistipes sp.]
MKSIYERITLYGPSSMTDSELLAIILENRELSERILAENNLTQLAQYELSRLRMVEGIGVVRAAKIAATTELGRRLSVFQSDKVQRITCADDAIQLLSPTLRNIKHEECWVLFLTNSSQVIEKMKISQGGVQATVVDNKLIVKRALELLSTQILIAHNHPSGCAEPSPADIAMTKRLQQAANLFDIKIIDHIIIAQSDHYSFKGNGLI